MKKLVIKNTKIKMLLNGKNTIRRKKKDQQTTDLSNPTIQWTIDEIEKIVNHSGILPVNKIE